MLKKVLLFAVVPLAMALMGGEAYSYDTAEVKDGGTISGKILFKGKAPEPKHFAVQKNPEVCGTTRDLVEVPVKDGVLQSGVVFLEGVEKGKAFEAKQNPAVMLKQDCNIIPYVFATAAKATMDIENQDPVMHNPHVYEVVGAARITMFNVGLPEKGSKLSQPVKLARKGKIVKVECDQHDFMHTWGYVVDNPYYALLSGGSYKIEGVPPGKYKLKVWAPIVGFQEAEVEVPASGNVTKDFEFTGA